MSSLPEKDAVLEWIRENPDRAGKREISRAFGLKGSDRIALKRILRELADEGVIERRPRRSFAPPGHLPPVTVLVADADADGDIWAAPQSWEGEGDPPRVLYVPQSRDPAVGEGDRILCRISAVKDEDHVWEGRLIRRIQSGPRRMLGVFRAGPDARVVPVAKGESREWHVPPGQSGGAKDGELVSAEALGSGRREILPHARIVERLGDPSAPRSVSLIALRERGIPLEFPQDAEDEARAARPAPMGEREDLRHLPLLTIDPADARDHDDAVCAAPDDDAANEGGWVVWVAIADVAHYVRPGSALDREARRRGNSTYFPDRVAPMLPEALSADLCSLHAGEDRPCIAVRMVLGADGELRGRRFCRGMMRSAASLTYLQAQAAEDGSADDETGPLAGPLADLFSAWRAAAEARERRAPLHLDLPERRVVLTETGEVASVAFRERLDAHRLIEEFMILANVCAAEVLEEKRRPFLHRVHEEPPAEKLDALRETAEACGLALAKGQVLKTAHLNRLLDAAAGGEFAELINTAVLRAQTQAYYAPEKLGHFGLNLPAYAHFTSPIRRYADLVAHRALVTAHRWGRDGQSPEEADGLRETGEHVSFTERRSMEAERDTNDRYLAAFLADRVGDEFAGRVSGVARFGCFVKLDETGADGLVPVSSLGAEWFSYDRDGMTLTGERSGRVIRPGMRCTVRLAEAVPLTGGLLLELLEIEGGRLPTPPRGKKGAGGRRRLSKTRIKTAKAARKAKRS